MHEVWNKVPRIFCLISKYVYFNMNYHTSAFVAESTYGVIDRIILIFHIFHDVITLKWIIMGLKLDRIVIQLLNEMNKSVQA